MLSYKTETCRKEILKAATNTKKSKTFPTKTRIFSKLENQQTTYMQGGDANHSGISKMTLLGCN